MRPQENVAQPPCWEQTGWFVKLPIIGGLNQPPRLREAKVASRHLLDRAATLLIQGVHYVKKASLGPGSE
jgi:hypothetical protein